MIVDGRKGQNWTVPRDETGHGGEFQIRIKVNPKLGLGSITYILGLGSLANCPDPGRISAIFVEIICQVKCVHGQSY